MSNYSDASGNGTVAEPERSVIVALERSGATLSLVGVVLIFSTFLASKRLRTVPNTFIVFASVANVGASIASLIGYSGIDAGKGSFLCQFQGFLLELWVVIWADETAKLLCPHAYPASCNPIRGGRWPWPSMCSWSSSWAPARTLSGDTYGSMPLYAMAARLLHPFYYSF